MAGEVAQMPKGRLLFVDALNIIAAFAVVLLHCSVTAYWLPVGSLSWLAGVLCQAVGIFAVPVFFMVSGMNLLGYRERYDTPTFFRRRLARVGVNLVVASIAIYVLYCLFPQSFYGAFAMRETMGVGDFVQRFLSNGICDVYWFLYAIIYLYVLTPLLSRFASDKRALEYILALTFFVSMVLPLAHDLGLPASATSTLFGWPLFASSNLFYFVAGYYISRYPVKLLENRRLLVCLFVGSTIGMVLYSLGANGVLAGQAAATYDSFAIGITDPLCAVQAISLFCLFKKAEPALREKGPALAAPLKALSAASLYIYMAHMVVINWMSVNFPAPVEAMLNRLPPVRAVMVFAVTALAVVGCQALFRRLRRGRTRRA